MLRRIQGRIIFLFSLLILTVGIALTLSGFAEASVSLSRLQRSMLQEQLRGSAAAARVYMEQQYGGLSLADGTLQTAGGLPIDADTGLVDRLQADLGVVATVFVKDGDDFRRITTNVLKEDGTRAVGTMLGKDSAAYPAVSAGKPYQGDAKILGKPYAASYEPIVEGGTVSGILFIGVSQAESSAQITAFRNRMLVVSGAISLGLLLVSIFIAFLIGRAVSRPILRLVRYSTGIAELDIRSEVPEDLLRRKDEIGQMANAFAHIVANLRDFLERVLGTSAHVSTASAQLHDTSEQVSRSADEVARTVTEIAQGATEQAKHTDSGVHGIEKLGGQLEENSRMMAILHDAAGQVITLQEEGTRILGRLVADTGDSRAAVESVAALVRETRSSAEQISRATDMIQQLAAQTNLLALNAAIEAARAGEAGRGFAVVADEIRTLATSSSGFVKEIDAIIRQLEGRTEHAVTDMETVESLIVRQSDSVTQTSDKFAGISDATARMRTAIEALEGSSRTIAEQNDLMIRIMQELAAISEENAAGAEQTAASVEEQTASMAELARAAGELSGISAEMREHVSRFKY